MTASGPPGTGSRKKNHVVRPMPPEREPPTRANGKRVRARSGRCWLASPGVSGTPPGKVLPTRAVIHPSTRESTQPPTKYSGTVTGSPAKPPDGVNVPSKPMKAPVIARILFDQGRRRKIASAMN